MLPGLTVRDVMNDQPIAVPETTTIRDVMRLMNEYRIGAVLIIGAGMKLVGIFSERDLLRRIVTAVPGWRDYLVGDWMTRDPHTIEPNMGWDEAVGLMTRLRVRHLPVLEDNRVIGIVTSRALMSRRSDHLDRVIVESTREIREANEELLSRDAELRQNLRAAGRLQQQLLLPKAPPDWPELEWALHFAPYDHLGGDYYDYAQPTPDHLGLLMADASGHSIAAAMIAIMTRIAFGEVADTTTSPGKVLTELNARLLNVADERFVTAFYGVLERSTRTFRYAAAGHPDPYLIDGATGEVKPLTTRGFLLGIMPDEMYVEKDIAVKPGDRIVFYTDGLTEARNGIGELYGSERLIACLNRDAPAAILDRILADQAEFCDGMPLTDDVTIAVLGVNG